MALARWVAVAAVVCSACGPIVRPAAFRHWKQSVSRGTYAGPFDGRVIEAASQKPIQNALVWCSWQIARGLGSSVPERAVVFTTKTDADGRYRVPALPAPGSGLSSRLASFILVVYRHGYVAYRSNRVFETGERRRDFYQDGNVVRLERWRPELSHLEHLVFIGGAPAVRRAAKEEVFGALADLDADRRSEPPFVEAEPVELADEQAPTIAGPARLLLEQDDVRRVTGFDGPFSVTPLADAGDATDSLHFRATERPESYDVALRVWRSDGDDLKARYERIMQGIKGSRASNLVGDRSFEASQGEILGLGFMDKARSVAILLTCGRQQCDTPEKLEELAKIVEQHLSRLPRRDTEESTAAPDATESTNPGL